MSRAERATIRLYEDPSLRADLTDDEANALLKWAEAEIARLDAAAPDDAAFNAGIDTLLHLTKSINRAAGSVGGFSAQTAERTAQIATDAQALGHPVEPAAVEAALAQPNPMSAVNALTSVISGETFGAPTAQSVDIPADAAQQDDQPPRRIVPPSDDYLPLDIPGEDDIDV